MKGIIKRIVLILHKIKAEVMTNHQFIEKLRKQGVRIGENVNFRYPAHTLIDTNRPCLVELGDNLDINDNFTILTHDFATFVFRGYYKDFVNCSGKVKIGNNIVFGRNVTILRGVTIGDNCIIGTGSIITKSIPPNSVAVGSPARVVCTLDEYYKKRKSVQVEEALEYGSLLAVHKGGVKKLKRDDFYEEWVLFLSEDEYKNDNSIRQHVDFRLKGRVDIHEFLNRPRPFSDFSAFLDAINKRVKKAL